MVVGWGGLGVGVSVLGWWWGCQGGGSGGGVGGGEGYCSQTE